MDLLLLPGMSARNEKWIQDVAEALSPFFGTTSVCAYAHWTSSGTINVEQELASAAERAKQLGDYTIFAKSAGAAITMLGINRGLLHPQKCIFVGTALQFAEAQDQALTKWAKDNSTPTLFIQNSHDPAVSAKKLKQYLADRQTKSYELIELAGDTHDYSDIPKLHDLCREFVL